MAMARLARLTTRQSRIGRALKRTQIDLLRAQADALEHAPEGPTNGGV